MHPCPGESFGPRAGVGGGQGEDEVGPAGKRGLHPDALRQQRHRAPLGEPAAHGHGHVPVAHGVRFSQLPCVAIVEGVVFGDDTKHRKPLRHLR